MFEASEADRSAIYASGRLVDTQVPVGALRFDPDDAGRELGDGRTVSGWSAFAGDETDEELTDAERVRMPSLSWLLVRDATVAEVTEGHDGTAGYWVRTGGAADDEWDAPEDPGSERPEAHAAAGMDPEVDGLTDVDLDLSDADLTVWRRVLP